MRERCPRLLVSSDGSAMVEFAVCLSLLVLVFVGMVDYALLIQEEMQVTEAANAGAAYGAVNGNQKDFAGMRTAAQNSATGVSHLTVNATNLFTCTPGGASVSSSTICSGYGTPVEYVQVTTSAAANPMLAYIGIPSTLVLQGSASFRVQWMP